MQLLISAFSRAINFPRVPRFSVPGKSRKMSVAKIRHQFPFGAHSRTERSEETEGEAVVPASNPRQIFYFIHTHMCISCVHILKDMTKRNTGKKKSPMYPVIRSWAKWSNKGRVMDCSRKNSCWGKGYAIKNQQEIIKCFDVDSSLSYLFFCNVRHRSRKRGGGRGTGSWDRFFAVSQFCCDELGITDFKLSDYQVWIKLEFEVIFRMESNFSSFLFNFWSFNHKEYF